MTYYKRLFRNFSLLLLLILLYGCASLSYYNQSISGQLEIFQKSKSIETWLKTNELDQTTRTKLKTILELRQFSVRELGLPDNKSYLSYADLGRDYVLWNIFATEEFSLQPIKWCYLIVGCLSYRGYFSIDDAKHLEATLRKQGYDVYLGGVAAYSTLGWFSDPVLNTMLHWDDIQLAKVMFHELAHQQFYIKNDTEFNEAYADTIALIGVRKWLAKKHVQKEIEAFESEQRKENQFIDLVMHYRNLLDSLYNSEIKNSVKRTRKAELFRQMREDYEVMHQDWNSNDYKSWFAEEINNAKLAAVITYRRYVPVLLEIYEETGGNLNDFYNIIKTLSLCTPEKREEILNKRQIKFEC